jgi:hypothetical protein
VSLGWTMMLMLERPNEALATEGCGVVAPDVGPAVAVGLPGLPTAVIPGAVVLFVTTCCAVGADGCRNSLGVRIHSQAISAQPAMSAQREGGSERVVVVNFRQADLMGDGIDYTVAGAPGRFGYGEPEDVKSGTVLEGGTWGQPGASCSLRSAPAIAGFRLGARALRAHERHQWR